MDTRTPPRRPETAMPPLDRTDLHPSVDDPVLTSMTTLNDIAGRFPDAVSFAAGRPYEAFYDAESLPRWLRRFQRHLEQDQRRSPAEINRTLFQYGRTKGFIHHLVARQLEQDEHITADPEAILVTTGCQEAMVLALRALRRGPQDVVLAALPAYVGFLGAARLVDMPVHGVREDAHGLDPDDLVTQVRLLRARGLRPRACYVVPDFANPSGATLPEERRRQLLDIADREDLLILEDNPYAFFGADGNRQPTLKSLDRTRRVLHFGSFAKTAFAGSRVGYVVADQPMTDGTLLADELAKLKSMLTLNTSTVSQAVIGGYLLEHGCSLVRATERERAVYRRNLTAVLDGLEQRFGGDPTVTWTTPRGGMFTVLTVPFTADEEALEHSARAFGVLWTPMHHFYGGHGGHRQLRLSFSALEPDRINTGLDRLAALVAERKSQVHMVRAAA
ncbi:PLP-dependent aminotransferase family protein [Streptomyces sp. NBC_00209]|uniref:aminotransferase-like domain-containing protein n=1 Tax=Streptomyces sp. NBC_00209 TaxID=2975682 RepID=UPI002F909293